MKYTVSSYLMRRARDCELISLYSCGRLYSGAVANDEERLIKLFRQ